MSRQPIAIDRTITVVAATALPAAAYSSVPHAVMRDETLIARDLEVYLCLDRVGRGRDGFPCSARAVAATIRCSVATVFRSFRRLVAAGHLRRIRRWDWRGGVYREVAAGCVLVGAPRRAARTKQGGAGKVNPHVGRGREYAEKTRARRPDRYRTDAVPRPTREELDARRARQRAEIPPTGTPGDYATHVGGVRAVLAAQREARLAATLARERR